jgi:SagB-type dehydrogenase family enzyme
MPKIDELRVSTDTALLDDVIRFHARGRVPSHERIFGTTIYPGYDPATVNQYEFGEYEFSPVAPENIPLAPPAQMPPALRRRGSVRSFSDRPVPFRVLSSLIDAAVCARDEAGHRPYPSGGGLYPIEAFIVPLHAESVEGLALCNYRVLAKSRALELVGPVPRHLRDVLFRAPMNQPSRPSFAIVYAAHFERCLVKYRYRGYRNALIEAGAMVQQVDLCAQALGLGTVPWAWFDDYEISKLLGLNPTRLPLVTMQLVGYPA